MEPPSTRGGIAARLGELRGMDTADGFRLRLVTLRTRIETNWPAAGGSPLRRRKGLDADATAMITDLLLGLPTPLPLAPGAPPQPLVSDLDTDLRLVAGRAVDAALALLSADSLEAEYPGDVHMLQSNRAGAPDPILISSPSVGLLVATIIGTLEAISERFVPSPPVLAGGEAAATARAAANVRAVLEAQKDIAAAEQAPGRRRAGPKRKRPVIRP